MDVDGFEDGASEKVLVAVRERVDCVVGSN